MIVKKKVKVQILFLLILSNACHDGSEVRNSSSNTTVGHSVSAQSSKDNQEEKLIKSLKSENSKEQDEPYNEKDSFMTCTWGGVPWRTYEITGHPDTALMLYAYRIIVTDTIPDFLDYDTHINLYNSSVKVKELMHSLFENEVGIDDIISHVDSINTNFYEFALTEVEKMKEKYGASEGPYHEFLQNEDGN